MISSGLSIEMFNSLPLGLCSYFPLVHSFILSVFTYSCSNSLSFFSFIFQNHGRLLLNYNSEIANAPLKPVVSVGRSVGWSVTQIFDNYPGAPIGLLCLISVHMFPFLLVQIFYVLVLLFVLILDILCSGFLLFSFFTIFFLVADTRL